MPNPNTLWLGNILRLVSGNTIFPTNKLKNQYVTFHYDVTLRGDEEISDQRWHDDSHKSL